MAFPEEGDWAADFRPITEIAETDVESEPTVEDDYDDFVTLMRELLVEVRSLNNHHSEENNALMMVRDAMIRNAEAIISSQESTTHLMMRKMEEMEDRLNSNDPQFTNLMDTDPELYQEIISREDDEDEIEPNGEDSGLEEVSQIEIQEAELPWSHLEEDTVQAYIDLKTKVISWQHFVKACGGIKKAGVAKSFLAEYHEKLGISSE
jgi:hypothetical protein